MKTVIYLFKGFALFIVSAILLFHMMCILKYALGTGYWPNSVVSNNIMLTLSFVMSLFVSLFYFVENEIV